MSNKNSNKKMLEDMRDGLLMLRGVLVEDLNKKKDKFENDDTLKKFISVAEKMSLSDKFKQMENEAERQKEQLNKYKDIFKQRVKDGNRDK